MSAPGVEIDTSLLIGGEPVAGAGDPLAVENPATEETLATVAGPSREQVDAAIAAARAAARGWERTPAVERSEMLHEVAARLRARTDHLAALMTAEGGKPLVENTDEVGWTAAAFDYYAEIGRDSAGRVIPPIEIEPAGAGGEGAARRCRLHRPLELPAAAARLEAGAGARGRQHRGLQALGVDTALHPRAGRLLRAPAARGRQPARRRRARSGPLIAADERIDCVAFTGSVETGKKVALACAERVARVNLEMGGKDPFIVCSDVARTAGSRSPRAEAPGPPT